MKKITTLILVGLAIVLVIALSATSVAAQSPTPSPTPTLSPDLEDQLRDQTKSPGTLITAEFSCMYSEYWYFAPHPLRDTQLYAIRCRHDSNTQLTTVTTAEYFLEDWIDLNTYYIYPWESIPETLYSPEFFQGNFGWLILKSTQDNKTFLGEHQLTNHKIFLPLVTAQ